MSLVTASGLSLAFGPKVLFQGATFSIGPRDRIGLVGANGTGKSSLLEILAGEAEEQLELSQTLADLHAELDHFEERFGRHRAEQVLSGLGFAPVDFSRPSSTLSGGWRMRAALEALLLISHDREFLNRQIGLVLALEPEGLRSYAGDYDAYRRQRAEEEERLAAAARRQEARRAELQGFIDRFGAKATKARQAQSRQKMLDRMEEVTVLERRAALSFRFLEAPRSGREVIRLEGVEKRFGDKVVYRGSTSGVQRGERVAVIGANGAGKTTLLRLVAGELAPDGGQVTL